MAATHELIETLTATGGSTTELEFTSIPQTYSDLEIVWSFKYNSFSSSHASYHNTFWRINGVTTSTVYPFQYQGMHYGSGSARWYYNTSTFFELLSGIAADNTYSAACGRMMFYDYTNSSTTGKSIQSFHSNMSYNADQYDRSMLAQSSNLNYASSVTSIKVYPYNNNYFDGESYMKLYGIDRSA